MNPLQLPVEQSELRALARNISCVDQLFAEELTQHVLEKLWRGKYDPSLATFTAWARRVMRNYKIDNYHQELRTREKLVKLSEKRSPVTSSLRDVEQDLDLTEQFCPADLNAVRSWTPRQQFVLLGWTGLFGKLPESDQQCVLAAVKPAQPFPVPGFLNWRDRDRTQYLADALQVEPNTITQIRMRGRQELQGLRFVRQLQPE
jgi:RNA polymerase sigma factor (sigma-70 family)